MGCYSFNSTVGIINASHVKYWLDLLETAHRRFLWAVETLARVRRLALATPALPINIANEGGKQVNLSGDHGGGEKPAGTVGRRIGPTEYPARLSAGPPVVDESFGTPPNGPKNGLDRRRSDSGATVV